MSRDPTPVIGSSAALNQALEHVSKLAPINRPVLILGERGTGKELAAERLHFLSPRWDQPLLKLNCAAMPESLLESELFGHESGAFTGANRTHLGRFERADGGTLFLDELGSMSLRLQEKLLRTIEYGEFERLGGSETLTVDVRVVGATNADLRGMAGAGEFRADLLDRLSFDVVHLPPLRHRLSDIPDLSHHFGVLMSRELQREVFHGFTDSAARSLLEHPWPGNIRELKNVIERSLHRWEQPDRPVGVIVLDPFSSPWLDAEFSSPEQHTANSEQSPSGDRDIAELGSFSARVARFEKSILVQALDQNNQHQRRTAETLKLSYDQLRGLLKKYRLRTRRALIAQCSW